MVSAGSGKDAGQAQASVAIPGSGGGSGGGGSAVAAALREGFLPEGFPHSVSDDYLSEQQPVYSCCCCRC